MEKRVAQADAQATSLLIVAGGSGTRMGTETPKQYLPLRGIPILMQTIRNIQGAFEVAPETILVVPESDRAKVEALLRQHIGNDNKITVVAGGKSRAESVHNGLKHCTQKWVAIHDGVRPFAPANVIVALIEELKKGAKGVVPALPSVDSLRKQTEEGGSTPINRSYIYRVQTPQCFRTTLIAEAYEAEAKNGYASATDDATLLQTAYPHLGITMVQGSEANLKITTQHDYLMAEWWAEKIEEAL